MIVPTAPIVPRDNNGGVRPILARADGVDDGCHPRRASAAVAGRVVGVRPVGYDPRYLWQLPVGDVGQYLRLRDYDVGPVGAGTNVLDSVGPGPDRANRGGIITPSKHLGIKRIHQCGMLEAGINLLVLVSER